MNLYLIISILGQFATLTERPDRLIERLKTEGFSFITTANRSKLPSVLQEILERDPRAHKIEEIRLVEGLFGLNLVEHDEVRTRLIRALRERSESYDTTNSAHTVYGIYLKYRI